MAEMRRKPKTQFDKKAASFVIRIWRESQTGDHGEWRGWIEHAQTRQRHYFLEMTEMNAIISRYLNDSGPEKNASV